MRKVSKNRTDDDVVSSTNGSIANEDQADPPRDEDDDVKLKDEDGDDADENNEDSDVSKETPKKKSSKKSKSKKKKQDKKGDEEEYEVEKVVGSKKIKGKLHYLIRWKGFSADSDTWEPENTLSCPDLISKFHDEKENSKNKDSDVKSNKKAKKRKSKGKETVPIKKIKTQWDSKSADANAEYEVERILEVHFKKSGEREFLIHWKGWSNKFDSWEPESNLNCSDLIKKFMDKVDKAHSTAERSLRVAPESTRRFTLQDPSSGRRLSKRRGQSQRVRYDNAE